MAPPPAIHPILLSILLFNHFFSGAYSIPFNLTNLCKHTIWPGLLSNAGKAQPSPTGFALPVGESKAVELPLDWAGRIWVRTGCAHDTTAGTFTCATADCGGFECEGRCAAPPATLAEFTLAGAGGMDFYDVSLVDGFNLPMLVLPERRGCNLTGCAADLNAHCPLELRLSGKANGRRVVACRSACEALGKPEYCCSGAYATPATCKPTDYSEYFKRACPRAYSYAYDDGTSTFTCPAGGGYHIVFCPAKSTRKCKGGKCRRKVYN